MNPRIQNLFLEAFPIHTAQFTPDGKHVVMSSRRKYFYIFDMASGEVRKVPNIQGLWKLLWKVSIGASNLIMNKITRSFIFEAKKAKKSSSECLFMQLNI